MFLTISWLNVSVIFPNLFTVSQILNRFHFSSAWAESNDFKPGDKLEQWFFIGFASGSRFLIKDTVATQRSSKTVQCVKEKCPWPNLFGNLFMFFWGCHATCIVEFDQMNLNQNKITPWHYSIITYTTLVIHLNSILQFITTDLEEQLYVCQLTCSVESKQ